MPEHGSFATVTARQQRLFVPSRIDLLPAKGPFADICCVDDGYMRVQPSLKSDRFAARASRAKTNNWGESGCPPAI
jgi:hypothetical protein